MKLKVYGIPNCNTMKNAFDFLTEQGIAYEFHNYKKSGIEDAQMRAFIKALGMETVLNKQGATFKQLSPEEKASLQDHTQAMAFLKEKTSAIKRPIFELNGRYLAGFKAEELKRWLNQ